MNAPAERPLFISQDKLVQWESEGKVVVDGITLTLVAEQRTYTLAEAVRFMRALGEEPPGSTLIGRVRTKDQLKQLNAEHYMGSVIIGDLGYEVQEGFVGTVVGRPVTAPVAPAPVTPAPRPAAPPAAATPAPVTAAPSPAPAPVPASAPVAAAPAAAPPATAAATPAVAAKDASDAELLANFLLANLGG